MSFGSKSLPPPTANESRRIDLAKEHGCIPCRMLGLHRVMGEYHHILRGGLRVGHRYGYVACRWHHQGIRDEEWTLEAMREFFGPSMIESRAYEARFGSDQAMQDRQDVAIGFPNCTIPTRRRSKGSAASPSNIYKPPR